MPLEDIMMSASNACDWEASLLEISSVIYTLPHVSTWRSSNKNLMCINWINKVLGNKNNRAQHTNLSGYINTVQLCTILRWRVQTSSPKIRNTSTLSRLCSSAEVDGYRWSHRCVQVIWKWHEIWMQDANCEVLYFLFVYIYRFIGL